MENLQWGEALRHWRQRRGMSRPELAEKLQVHPDTIKRWEKESSLPFRFNAQLLEQVGFVYEPLPPQRGTMEENPSTYFVQDRSSKDELKRLTVLDRILTQDMGGVLPEQVDPARFQYVLDVGCGIGGWLVELARQQPTGKFVGVDASKTMIENARELAGAAGVSDRVEFHIADALSTLEFSNRSFDLVNHRAAASWLRTWDWPRLLHEYKRVCRSGGVLRVTELDWFETNSPAFSVWTDIFLKAMDKSGHLFRPGGDGVTVQLEELLQQQGLAQVQTKRHSFTYSPDDIDDSGWMSFYGNTAIVCRTALPFLQKWVAVPGDYDALCKQLLTEIARPGFVAKCDALTAWGINRNQNHS